MTESRAYDDGNRLTERKSVECTSTVSDYDYTCNATNQGTRIDIGESSPTYVKIDLRGHPSNYNNNLTYYDTTARTKTKGKAT